MFKKELPFNALTYVAVWFVLLGILIFLFSRWHASNLGGIESIIVNDVERRVLIRMSKSHRYHLMGRLNKVKASFVIDTGANTVAVPLRLAREAGLSFLSDINIETASGSVKGSMTRIREITLGPIRLGNIKAVILPAGSNYVLLGMSALKKLKLSQKNNLLTLTQPINN